MFIGFDVVTITTDMPSKKITIETTYDVDIDTTGGDAISLLEKESNKLINYTVEIDGRLTILNLSDWPIPNKEYVLLINSNLKTITGDSLNSPLKRTIAFASDISSTVIITSPSNFESIERVKIAWREIQSNSNEQFANAYDIEIAKDTAFYSSVIKSEVENKNEIIFQDLQRGIQYYIRIRAKAGDQYGAWSDTTTFIFVGSSESNGDSVVAPILINGLRLVSSPSNGDTPTSFIFRFDSEIDASSLDVDSIVLTRRSM